MPPYPEFRSLTEPAGNVANERRHKKEGYVLIKQAREITQLHASLYGMDFEALAHWLEHHPWAAFAALVLVAGFVARAVYRRADLKRRPSSMALLRSKQEQARFEPVQTVYVPRQFRRERPGKK